VGSRLQCLSLYRYLRLHFVPVRDVAQTNLRGVVPVPQDRTGSHFDKVRLFARKNLQRRDLGMSPKGKTEIAAKQSGWCGSKQLRCRRIAVGDLTSVVDHQDSILSAIDDAAKYSVVAGRIGLILKRRYDERTWPPDYSGF
ncbi:MAG: hypothetical protein RLN70_01185, partial [Rhodospirillaceae bacterium]